MTKQIKLSQATVVAITAGIICFIVYLRALGCDFVNWDDQGFVLENTAIRHLDAAFFRWAFASPPIDLYVPLTYLSYALDYQFWELNPFGYHLTNVLLHAINAGLVVLIADRVLQGVGCRIEGKYLYPGMLLVAGLLWGIHPLRVESVAWVAERKDVLNGLFLLSSLLYYLKYVQQKDASQDSLRYYLTSLTLFALSLLAKPISVVIPVILLVIDWYPLKRLHKGNFRLIFFEKVPFFLLALLFSLGTIYLAASEFLMATSALSVAERFVVAGNGLFEYFRLMLFPVGILPVHLLPDPIPHVFLLKAIAATCFCGVILYAGRNRPWVLMTLLCFVIPFLPVLGFIQNGYQAFAVRFTYLPSIVPSIVAALILVKGGLQFSGKRRILQRVVLLVLPVAVLACYTAGTQRLIGVWQDTATLWSRQIAYQPFGRAFFWRGLYYMDKGMYDAAADDFTTCLPMAAKEKVPDLYNLYAFRGEAYSQAGRFNDAVLDLSHAITAFPHPLYYFHRGIALQGLGKLQEAAEDFRKAGNARGVMRWVSP